MSDSLQPHGLYSPWNSPGQNTGVGSLSLLQGVFLTQELNWGLLHCRRILYQLSYQGNPQFSQPITAKKLAEKPIQYLLLFSHSVISDSLRPCGLQHSRLPCPSPSLRICSNSCPLNQWCHTTILSSGVPFSYCPQSFPASRSFLMSFIRWPKYWSFSFSISPSHEHSGLISFRMDCLDLLVVQGILKSLLQHHSSKASILQHSAFFKVQVIHTWLLEKP